MNGNSLRLDLSLEDANLILDALGQLPFVRVYRLIAQIQEQARNQLVAGESSGRPGGDATRPAAREGERE